MIRHDESHPFACLFRSELSFSPKACRIVQQIYYSEFGVWHQAEKKIVAALVSCYTITIIVWLQIVSTAWKL